MLYSDFEVAALIGPNTGFDPDAVHVVAQLYWLRYTARPLGAGRNDLAMALRLFAALLDSGAASGGDRAVPTALRLILECRDDV